MKIRLRQVPYGTSFIEQASPAVGAGTFRLDPWTPGVDVLCANEVAVDVGGVCYGYQGERRLVFDHHFDRGKENFPSAAAAVIHHAKDISEQINARAICHSQFAEDPQLWIAVHDSPDFDALCAAYLVRSLFEAASGDVEVDSAPRLLDPQSLAAFCLSENGWSDILHEDGRVKSRRFDWFKASHRALTLDHPARWAILLAAYASCVDNCKHISAPRATRLHSVLYAADQRGREIGLDGMRFFFDEARKAITNRGLNPLFDSLFDASSLFAPELALLVNEEIAYLGDIHRARRTLVSLQVRPDFSSWYKTLKEEPLFASTGGKADTWTINQHHLTEGQAQNQNFRLADGIFLRDPECLLFKEWAREDFEHSTCGEGFLFTAIAYSAVKPGAKNEGRYYFALNPERAQVAHLYDVWALIQAEECKALQSDDCKQVLSDEKAQNEKRGVKVKARDGFEGRAGTLQAELSDPWYDGSNYCATIIDTPNRGTMIPGGQASDLSDDQIAMLVTSCIEFRAFHDKVELRDYSPSGEQPKPVFIPVQNGPKTSLPLDIFRFGKVRLDERIDLGDRVFANQIGARLWPFLEPEGLSAPPANFVEYHLIVQPGRMVVVWNRHGIIAGYQQHGEAETGRLREYLEKASRLVFDLGNFYKEIEPLAHDMTSAKIREEMRKETEKMREAGFGLLQRTAELRLNATMPEGEIWRRFVEATRLDELARMLHEINEGIRNSMEAQRAKEEAQTAKDEENRERERANVLTGIAFILSFLGFPSLMAAVLALDPGKTVGWEHSWLVLWEAHPYICLLISLIPVFIGLVVFVIWRMKRSSSHAAKVR